MPMKFFKDEQGEVYAFDGDGSQDDFIAPSLTAITQAEADALRSPPPLSVEQRIAALLARVDAHLDAGAALRRYDNIRSAALRAGYPGPFHDEGVVYATWMDATYATCYQILEQWTAGQIEEEPTADELIAMLPPLVLPA